MGVVNEKQKTQRLGEEKYNYQGCLMKIIEYNKASDIVVEFQDDYKYRVKTRYDHFKDGSVKNRYGAGVQNYGISGNKYKLTNEDGSMTKEYQLWCGMIRRTTNESYKEKNPWYKDVTCCPEWLCYDNFYEWMHNEPNFDTWNNLDQGAVDKDIICKGNKCYDPAHCVLVPQRINSMMTNRRGDRGLYPIGVHKQENKFISTCCDGNANQVYLGIYDAPEDAFYAYKEYKEKVIKRVADEEYNAGNITKRCRDALYAYEVEITD